MRVIRTSLFGRGGLRLVCFAVLGFQQLGEFVYQLRNHRHSTIRRGSVIVDLHHTALALFDHNKGHRGNGDATTAATAEPSMGPSAAATESSRRARESGLGRHRGASPVFRDSAQKMPKQRMPLNRFVLVRIYEDMV